MKLLTLSPTNEIAWEKRFYEMKWALVRIWKKIFGEPDEKKVKRLIFTLKNTHKLHPEYKRVLNQLTELAKSPDFPFEFIRQIEEVKKAPGIAPQKKYTPIKFFLEDGHVFDESMVESALEFLASGSTDTYQRALHYRKLQVIYQTTQSEEIRSKIETHCIEATYAIA